MVHRALALFLLVGSIEPASTPDVRATVARLQRKYDTLRDFRAEFVQIYEGGVIRKRTQERGTVYVKRPGKMRWEYGDPDRKLFVADGVKLYSYLPADRQVIVSDAPSNRGGRSPVLFLLGEGDLEHDFAITAAAAFPDEPALIALKLVPRVPQPDYDTLVLGVTSDALQIARLVALDAQGGRSEFRFRDIRENTSLSDKLFVFKMPRGVQVITDEPKPSGRGQP